MALRVDDVDLVRDRALVERFQEGDPAAFDTLYTRYFGRLVRFCQKRVGDPHEAEEIAQEAFTKALRALPTFEGERRFYPWMTVIAGRLCVDAHRRRGRTEPSDSVDLGVIEGGQEKIVDLVDLEILRTAMSELAPRHREVLDLRELQGWSYQQIADHYDVTLGTVEALLFRARKALKREFMAVVGGDRNWAALPVFGGVLARGAAFKAKVQAWASAALPTVSGPVVAAALAVTAVTGAVGVGVLENNRPSQPPTVLRLGTPASQTTDAPVSADAATAAGGGAAGAASVAGPVASGRARTAEEAPEAGRPLVGETPVADGKTYDEGRTEIQDDPVQVDVAREAFASLDPDKAAADVVTSITSYLADPGADQ